MNVVLVVPAVLALLTLAAHVLRLGNVIWTGELVVLALLLPFVRYRWMLRLSQVVLVLGAAEWVRTLYAGVQQRVLDGQPYQRMVYILGGTALFTVLAALLLQTRRARARYPRAGLLARAPEPPASDDTASRAATPPA